MYFRQQLLAVAAAAAMLAVGRRQVLTAEQPTLQNPGYNPPPSAPPADMVSQDFRELERQMNYVKKERANSKEGEPNRPIDINFTSEFGEFYDTKLPSGATATQVLVLVGEFTRNAQRLLYLTGKNLDPGKRFRITINENYHYTSRPKNLTTMMICEVASGVTRCMRPKQYIQADLL